MRWSFKIARVSGIDIRVHSTFALIVLLGAWQFASFGLPGILFGIALILLLFVCVTLHELGHSVVAQGFGVEVRQIVLLPIGGVAMMQRIPRNPFQELWIALAGPAVNVVIAFSIWLGISAQSWYSGVSPVRLLTPEGGPSGALMLQWLFTANVALVIFNMIPAFPLDGGRVLRALLAMSMHYQKATDVAATVGQVIAVLLGIAGLMSGQYLLMFIAAFIFLGAGAESVEGRAQAVLSGVHVGNAYNKHALVLSPYDRLGTVVQHILTSYQPDFAVIDGRRLHGVVTRGDVIQALSAGVGNVPVESIMHEHPVKVSTDQTLDEVRQALAEGATRLAAVYDGPNFLGLVSSEDIEEAYAVLQFVNGRASSVSPSPDNPLQA